MTDTTAGGWAAPRRDRAATDRPAARAPQAATAPPRRRYRGPVFIHDCHSAWGGEPMLLLLHRAWAARDADEDEPPRS